MSIADNIRQMRADGCTEEFIYKVMLASSFHEIIEALEVAFAEVDEVAEADKGHLHKKVTHNVAAAAIQMGAGILAKQDVDITLHYLAQVARMIVPDEEIVAEEPTKTPKDTSKLN